jgi:hypothetical protein
VTQSSGIWPILSPNTHDQARCPVHIGELALERRRPGREWVPSLSCLAILAVASLLTVPTTCAFQRHGICTHGR